jgi:hypothetical protein
MSEPNTKETDKDTAGSQKRVVRRFFRDIESGANMEDDKEYHAAGIVLEKVADGCVSLKDMTVMYLNPFTGYVEYCWRATKDVIVYECTEDDGVDWLMWERTKKALETLKRIQESE